MNDFDFGTLGREENNRVESGHVDAFGQTAHVAKDTAGVAVKRRILELAQFGGARGRFHCDIFFADLARTEDETRAYVDERIFFGVAFAGQKFFSDDGEIGGVLFGFGDCTAEGNGGVHERIFVVDEEPRRFFVELFG